MVLIPLPVSETSIEIKSLSSENMVKSIVPDLFSIESMSFYNYKLAGIINVDGRETYIIEFDQKDNVDLVLYKGKVYLDVNTLAFTGLDFSISEKRIERAAEQLVRKKPVSMKVNVLGLSLIHI